MKTLRKKPRNHCIRAASTVSAAVLMLGVSHAATVGFNFQAHYCGAASYSGAPVTAAAFGIPPENWESLTPMDSGYGCTPGYYTLEEVVDTGTADSGLNPLPEGSIDVTWSAFTANVSGFGGYGRPGPHYTFGGTGHRPGEEEVYWGFLRDGVNFGPGSSGGDNNQPGYVVELTGLKSLWKSGPFVVQLIASADSMETLADAFVVDASLSVTQRVAYASTPPVGNSGDTAWTRGIGGGISTPSGSIDTDHLIITGDRASHVPNPGGYNHASTIAGFIITDQPVVTMSPQPVTAGRGDQIVLRAGVIGVPPLSIQWRKDGVAIPGATGSTYSHAVTGAEDAGDYDVVATNTYGSATSQPATLTIDRIGIAGGPQVALDTKPTGLDHAAVIHGATWLANDAGHEGVVLFAADNADQVTVAAHEDFNTSVGTISLWLRYDGSLAAGHDGAMILDRRTGSGNVVVLADDGTIFLQAGGGGNSFHSTGTVNDGAWHHVAVVYDQSATGKVSLFLDGVKDSSQDNTSAWSWPASQEIELGHSHDGYWRSYGGSLDDVRLYGRMLTETEVMGVFTGDASAVVASADLKLRLNFDAGFTTGEELVWLTGPAVLQVADDVTGPYSDVGPVTSPYDIPVVGSRKFYRLKPLTILSNPYDM